MTTKTIKLFLPTYAGQSGLKLRIRAREGTSIVNGTGTTLTAGNDGEFSCTVTDVLSGWHKCSIVNSSDDLLEAGGLLYVPDDEAGTYWVDDTTYIRTYLAAIKSKTDLIGTGSATVVTRVSGTYILAFVDETLSTTITTSTTLTGLTLQCIIELRDTDDKVVIANSDITKTGTQATFTIGSAVTNAERFCNWALRNTSNGEVIAYGVIEVVYQPKADT